MPGGHPLPHSGLGHVDHGESAPGSLPLIHESSVEAGQLAPVPGDSGVGKGISAPMPVDHSLSAAWTCEDDEEEVPPNQKAYECRKGTGPSKPSLTLLWLLMAQAVCEETQCRSLKEPKPCSGNFQFSRDWYDQARSFYLPERASMASPPVNEELVVYSQWATHHSLSPPGFWCKWKKFVTPWLILPLGQTRF
ncbi:hypothetical protein E2C01_050702 [Portunus trituberculatus]|uniref:Uncharacterized protein n=1 Tax=Portunus trituberculatus TaxID=210409 RepID=A0A5B7GGQ2_PORTR|nr:hypothetical protein [Portunus trituberculatus]